MIGICTSTNSFELLLFSSKNDDKTTFYFSKICGRPSQRVDNSSFRQPNHPIQERKKVNLTSQLSERAIVYTRNILCWCGYFVGVGGERKRKCLCCKYPMIRKRIFSYIVAHASNKNLYTRRRKRFGRCGIDGYILIYIYSRAQCQSKNVTT